MTDDPVALWREALKTDDHPLHRAAWLLFSSGTNPEYAARALAPQKETLLPHLYQILDRLEVFHDDSAFGGGYGPINAAALFSEWQVMEAVPYLLDMLEVTAWEDLLHEVSLVALQRMGPPILETILTYCGEVGEDEDLQFDMAAVLAVIGQGDARAFDWVRRWMEEGARRDDGVLAGLLASALLDIDLRRAKPLLQTSAKNRKYTEAVRDAIQDALDEEAELGH